MEITVNITLKIDDTALTDFESWLRNQLEVVDVQIVPNTKQMYLQDTNFKKLLKQKKDLQRTTWNYIMKNNHKYLENE
jgi:hypothetical protein|tara:strand:- start:1247 stop:1480 length:234 start_codon:yes stop_codon:yes gene_type:complete